MELYYDHLDHSRQDTREIWRKFGWLTLVLSFWIGIYLICHMELIYPAAVFQSLHPPTQADNNPLIQITSSDPAILSGTTPSWFWLSGPLSYTEIAFWALFGICLSLLYTFSRALKRC